MKYEYRKLRGRIVEVFRTHRAFAKELGLSENSLSKKLNGRSQFDQNDMERWAELLKIPFEEIGLYFFS